MSKERYDWTDYVFLAGGVAVGVGTIVVGHTIDRATEMAGRVDPADWYNALINIGKVAGSQNVQAFCSTHQAELTDFLFCGRGKLFGLLSFVNHAYEGVIEVAGGYINGAHEMINALASMDLSQITEASINNAGSLLAIASIVTIICAHKYSVEKNRNKHKTVSTQ